MATSARSTGESDLAGLKPRLGQVREEQILSHLQRLLRVSGESAAAVDNGAPAVPTAVFVRLLVLLLDAASRAARVLRASLWQDVSFIAAGQPNAAPCATLDENKNPNREVEAMFLPSRAVFYRRRRERCAQRVVVDPIVRTLG
ncbi:hypothetical protein [Accumulibacter sp.]|uniref:hypothetical protein n=1 Tax=Accumulibacter sp. TaxID=2053492 RepID=UPI0035AD9291